jgi:hypothetical protein
MKQYTYEFTPSVLVSYLNPFSTEQLANANEEQRQISNPMLKKSKTVL